MISQYRDNPESFPTHGQVKYDQIFIALENELNTKIHPNIAAYAALRNQGGFLTDHGPRHIEMVMRRASALINDSKNGEFSCKLTPYEGFLLLLSIHCHDVGNIYGREGHETRILDILSKFPDFQKLKASEQRQIAQIASTHGGNIDGDKDTIGKVLTDGTVELLSQPIRPQLLAAILRLADELSDEHSRADEFGLLHGQIPPESEIYHRFAKCLETVKIDREAKRIHFEFCLYPPDILSEFGKKKKADGSIEKTYLLDEIHMRTKKAFSEMIYCMKFMRELITPFQKLDIKLLAFPETQNAMEPFCKHSYVIREKGYPGFQDLPFNKLCDDFDDLDGKSLKEKCQTAQSNV